MLRRNGPEGSSLTAWTSIASSLYLPAVAVPAGLSDDDVPVALQLVGRRFGDHNVVRATEFLEAAFAG